MILIAQYLLAGLVTAFLIEQVIRFTDQTVNGWERYFMIVFWPLILVVFIFYFIKGLLNGED